MLATSLISAISIVPIVVGILCLLEILYNKYIGKGSQGSIKEENISDLPRTEAVKKKAA